MARARRVKEYMKAASYARPRSECTVRSLLPPPAERKEQRHFEIRRPRLRPRERHFRLGEREVRLQHVEEADLTCVEARVRECRRLRRMAARRLERGAPLELLAVVGQCAFDLAQRIQPRAVERREGGLRARLRLREPGPRDGAIRKAE